MGNASKEPPQGDHFTGGIIGTLLSSLLLDRWWRERTYDLNGKTILMTGGSRGLGLVMTRQLIEAGARLAICARDTTELEQAQTELEQRGGEVLALPCNVTDQTQVEQMVQQVRDRFGAGVPIVNSDYQPLARWSAFFLAAWEDIKLWRERPEYQLLKQDIVQKAGDAASRLCPAVAIGEREVRDLLDNPEDFEQIQQTVQMFKDVLPELIVQDALFHLGLVNPQPVTTI
ncbi:SDR family NAD(P)-dependent oxidoreductase [Scytonema sp. PRP1]|uniref:SDR family NAD(P)-dependent oxidoreductase n=1 Tax=Scytonema sp. PRP1 TaxID=3120513 RepID=UPI002FCF7BEF